MSATKEAGAVVKGRDPAQRNLVNPITPTEETDVAECISLFGPSGDPDAPCSARHGLGSSRGCRPRVIEGFLRTGEIANIVSGSKSGKSWLSMDLALSVVTGRKWLGRFETSPGEVLIVDAELHRETFYDRLRKVAQRRGITEAEYADELWVRHLRGTSPRVSIDQLESWVLKYFRQARLGLIILDTLSAMLPEHLNENDNGNMMGLYGMVHSLAERAGAAIVLIHHSSKGDQSTKRRTDVGSGAGAQSRAADSHIILRNHQETDAAVLEGDVRSWARPAPVGLRWTFPVWDIDQSLDTTLLASEYSTGRRRREPTQKPPKPAALTFEEFWNGCLSSEPKTRAEIISEAVLLGASQANAKQLLARAVPKLEKTGGGNVAERFAIKSA
jgi:hypothetical protein